MTMEKSKKASSNFEPHLESKHTPLRNLIAINRFRAGRSYTLELEKTEVDDINCVFFNWSNAS